MCYNISKINARQKNNLLYIDQNLGVVQAVFSSTCLIQIGKGLLLAVHNYNAVFSPMSLLAPAVKSFSSLGIVQGDPVKYCQERRRLLIGDLSFDCSGSEFLSTQVPICCQKLDYSYYLGKLEEYLREKKAFLYRYFKGVPFESQEIIQNNLLGTRFIEAGDIITEGLIVGRDEQFTQGLRGLFGLGPGLTPSGDDFFLGLATALLTSSRYAEIFGRQKNHIQELTQVYTTRLSQAFISYFMEDCYSWPVYQLIEALNSQDILQFTRQLPAVGNFGYSSGQDYLSGLWWGLEFLEKQSFNRTDFHL